MKNLIVLLFVGLTGVSCLEVVSAQEILIAPPGSDLGGKVPELAMPQMPETALGHGQQVEAEPNEGEFGIEDPSEQYATTPLDDTWESGTSIEQLEPYVSDDYQMYQYNDAGLESTGTWIRRGFWYAEVDAVIFNHKFNRRGVPIILQPTGTTISQLNQQGVESNQLRLDGSKPGAETTPRFTLGHFLFRDHRNRDHVAEFTAFGGGQWTQQARLEATPNNDLANQGSSFLVVPTFIDLGNTSFDGARSSQFRYDSRFNSFELNYLVKDRMGLDLMEMEPSGHWVRRAGSSVTRSLLAGVRYFDLSEEFDWTAADIGFNDDLAIAGENGRTRMTTDNDMIGTQLGFSWGYETARWSGTIRAKGGMFVNQIDLTSFHSIPIDGEFEVSEAALEADELSFIGEAALTGKWHLRPNFSLRAGVELLFLSSTAIAPSQHLGMFAKGGPASVASNGDSTYLGGSIGFEGYW